MSKQKAKHTPGPWKTRKGFGWYEIDIFAPNPKIKKPFQPTELAIFRLVGTTIAEHKANARLIAAAPELLESLKEVVGLAYPHPLENKVLFAACEAAKAIIAKAEGN